MIYLYFLFPTIQHSLDLLKFEDQSRQIESLQTEREGLREELSRLQSRTEYFESSTVDKETIIRWVCVFV